MNPKFKDIANKYEITEEAGKQILGGLKIENIDKNPSPLQLEGFELVCDLVKEGVDLVSAVAQVEESWAKSETEGKAASSSDNGNGQVKTSSTVSAEFNNIDIDSIIDRQVEETAKHILASLPKVSEAEYDRFRESYVKKLRQVIASRLLQGNFSQNFAKYVNAKVEEHRQGKLKYIESIQTPLVSSPENSALPPGK